VKEAMEKSMAEGSQTFEAAIAKLIIDGVVDKKEGIANADSATNLQWRLQNDFAAKDLDTPEEGASEEDLQDEPSFTEISLDVKQ
jgi:twitching motility protein PilU